MITGIDGKFYSFECAALYNERCYFIDFNGNSICSFEVGDSEVRLEVTLPEKITVRMFSTMIIKGGVAYIFPFNAQGIYKVELDTKKIIEVDYPLSFGQAKSDPGKFISAYLMENKIYVLGSSWSIVLIYDIVSESIKIIDFRNELEKYTILKNEKSFFCKGWVYKDFLYFTFCKGNAIIYINSKDDSFGIEIVNGVDDGFSSIIKNDKGYWLTSRQDQCIYGKIKDEPLIQRQLETNRDFERAYAYIDFVELSDGIILLGFLAYLSFEYDETKKSFEKIRNTIFKGREWIANGNAKTKVISSVESGKIIIIKNGNIKEYRLKYSEKKENEIIRESIIDSLEEYIK